MKYRVHIAYVNFNGCIMPAGIYSDEEIDIAEARHKSILTLADINVQTEKSQEIDSVGIKKIVATDSPDIDVKEKELHATVSTFQVKRFLINSASLSEVEALKYVGKSTAKKVIDERAKTNFTSYVDLDNRIPLRLGKKWQDITAIDFENTVPMTVENAVQFI